MPRLALILCTSLLASVLAAADPVLLCWASGTPSASQTVAADQVDAVTMPTPQAVNGGTVAKAVAAELKKREIEFESFDLSKRQPTLAQWNQSTAIFVAPVYNGGTHWAMKKLIDDRNGALYYAKAGSPPQRAAVLLLTEGAKSVGGAMGDFNSAGSPFPGRANRIDRILEVGDQAGITTTINDVIGLLFAKPARPGKPGKPGK